MNAMIALGGACRKSSRTFILTLFLTNVPLIIHADGRACLDHHQLLALPSDDIHRVLPCDLVGAGYVLGARHLRPSPSSEGLQSLGSLPPELSYYHFVRSYLALNRASSSHTSLDDDLGERLGMIIGMLAFLPHDDINSNRNNYYRVFAMGEYMDLSRQQVEGGDMRFHPRSLNELIPGVMYDLMTGGDFVSYRELVCFIDFDIPTLEVGEIIASKNVSNCINSDR